MVAAVCAVSDMGFGKFNTFLYHIAGVIGHAEKKTGFEITISAVALCG